MTSPVNKTLIALLVALSKLKEPVNEKEVEAFSDASFQLYKYGTNWEKDYQQDLLTVIEANPTFYKHFKDAQSQLNGIDDNILLNFIRDMSSEIEKVIHPELTPVERAGNIPVVDDNDLNNSEIHNVSIKVFSSPDPADTIKKINFLERFKQRFPHQT